MTSSINRPISLGAALSNPEKEPFDRSTASLPGDVAGSPRLKRSPRSSGSRKELDSFISRSESRHSISTRDMSVAGGSIASAPAIYRTAPGRSKSLAVSSAALQPQQIIEPVAETRSHNRSRSFSQRRSKSFDCGRDELAEMLAAKNSDAPVNRLSVLQRQPPKRTTSKAQKESRRIGLEPPKNGTSDGDGIFVEKIAVRRVPKRNKSAGRALFSQ